MGIRQTHTYAKLELSKAAYDEITTKLKAAGYDHSFMDDGTIDMHSIGVTREEGNTDQTALDATNAVMKAWADMSHAPYAQVKANVQTIIAEALRK